jgi:hypothetical protein
MVLGPVKMQTEMGAVMAASASNGPSKIFNPILFRVASIGLPHARARAGGSPDRESARLGLSGPPRTKAVLVSAYPACGLCA